MTLQELIAEAERDLLYGTVQFTLKKSAGNITTVDTTRITRRKVSGNAEALTTIGTMLKLLRESGETGNLTFTVTLDKGEASQLMTHDFRRTNLNNGQYS